MPYDTGNSSKSLAHSSSTVFADHGGIAEPAHGEKEVSQLQKKVTHLSADSLINVLM